MGNEARKTIGRVSLLDDTRGALTTEYVALVGLVALGFVFALVALGPVLVERYQHNRSVVASPYP